MDDTRQPGPERAARRVSLPFIPAAVILGGFALLAVWPPVIPGLPRAPRLVLIAVMLAGTLAWLSSRGPSRRTPRARRRPGRGRERHRHDVAAVPAAAMISSPAWLHVVSGPDPARLRRGLLEAAAALVGHGERLLIVDGARRLRFHDAMRRESGPGLLECLIGELPVLEAIQGGVAENPCFLPRGNPMRPEVWSQLGRLMLELRTRFDRVLLALDFAVPHAVGPALEGLEAAGWWCPDDGASILSAALAERIGIPLRNMMLSMSEEVLDEIAGQSVGAFEAGPGSPAAPIALRERDPWDLGVGSRAESQIVDCDLQVRERLRFLVWMRGVQAEGHRELEAQR